MTTVYIATRIEEYRDKPRPPNLRNVANFVITLNSTVDTSKVENNPFQTQWISTIPISVDDYDTTTIRISFILVSEDQEAVKAAMAEDIAAAQNDAEHIRAVEHHDEVDTDSLEHIARNDRLTMWNLSKYTVLVPSEALERVNWAGVELVIEVVFGEGGVAIKGEDDKQVFKNEDGK
jgi:hypothetical protein